MKEFTRVQKYLTVIYDGLFNSFEINAAKELPGYVVQIAVILEGQSEDKVEDECLIYHL